MLFIGDNLIILFTNTNWKDSFPKGYCFNVFLFGSLRSPSGKFVFLRPSGRVLRLRFVYGKCKKYILFYNGDESQGVLEQPFYEWCSLYIKNIG